MKKSIKNGRDKVNKCNENYNEEYHGNSFERKIDLLMCEIKESIFLYHNLTKIIQNFSASSSINIHILLFEKTIRLKIIVQILVLILICMM